MTTTIRCEPLPEGITPTFKLSTRAAEDTLLATVYTGVAVTGRPTIYTFSTSVAAGDYAITQLEDPRAIGVCRITTGETEALMADSFADLDLLAGDVGVTLYDIEASEILAKQAALIVTRDSVLTLISRLGAFTGSGVNTVLGFFKALLRKDATLPSDIGGTYDNTTDSLEKSRNIPKYGDDQVWDNGTDTINVTATKA